MIAIEVFCQRERFEYVKISRVHTLSNSIDRSHYTIEGHVVGGLTKWHGVGVGRAPYI